MRISCTLSLAVGLFFASQSCALFPGGHSVWERRSPDLKKLEAHPLGPRDVVSFDDHSDDDPDGDDTADDEESDYAAGVYERLDDMLYKIQPSVDEIQTLSNNANDMNADEYADKISTHLGNIASAGDSLSNSLSSEEATDSGVEKREITPECDTCHKKKKHHYKHKHCHKCKKRSRHECGHLLWKWLKACKVCVSAVLSCKARAVKEKCREHVPKITKCCARVVSSCGKHGISQTFRSLAQVDITAFVQLGFGASAVASA